MKPTKRILPMTMAASLMAAGVLQAAVTVPQADGSDGAFTPTESVVIDLSLAAEGTLDVPSPSPGNGVFMPGGWGVVFRYSEVQIPSGVTVTFANHPSRAPVYWLVSGPVTIDGTVALDGSRGHAHTALRTFAEPAPGGFRGGRGSDSLRHPSGGFGPGGAQSSNSTSAGSGGSYGGSGAVGNSGAPAGPLYGNERILPLIGGSGGSGGNAGSGGAGGGAGGGAILIACPGVVTVNGLIRANGGQGGADVAGFYDRYDGGGGSGGAIRIVADLLAGSGRLQALGGPRGQDHGGSGGPGRIRVEANEITMTDLGSPAFTIGLPGETATIFPPPGAPAIRSISLGDEPVPADPRANMTSFTSTDVAFTGGEEGPFTLVLLAENTPPDASVTVRLVRGLDTIQTVDAEFVQDNGDGTSDWRAVVEIDEGFTAIQASVTLP